MQEYTEITTNRLEGRGPGLAADQIKVAVTLPQLLNGQQSHRTEQPTVSGSVDTCPHRPESWWIVYVERRPDTKLCLLPAAEEDSVTGAGMSEIWISANAVRAHAAVQNAVRGAIKLIKIIEK